MNVKHFLEASKHYFQGAFELVDDDLPDGAWWQMHEDIAESQINDCCDILGVKRPKHIDGHDIVQYYIQNK